MPSRIQCPQCENAYAYSPALLGKTVKCRQCQHTFTITAPPPEDPAPAAPQPNPAPALAAAPATSTPTPAPKSGPPPLPPRPAADKGSKPGDGGSKFTDKGSKSGVSRRRDPEPDEGEEEDRPPVGDRDRDDRPVRSRRARDDEDDRGEDEDERPSRRKPDRGRPRPGPRPAAPERESSPLLLVGLIAAFILGFLVIAAGIAYLLWPSSTPSTTQTSSGPAAPADQMAAADPPKNLDEIIKEAPNRKEEVAGPPPERPKFEVPKFDPPDAKRGPRGGGPNPPAFDFPRFEPPRGLPGRPEDKPKPALAAPKFRPVEPLPITPTPMATDRVERAMPGPVENVVVAGGGRLLLLHLPRERRVVVFDVSKGERVKILPAEDAGARIAGGMNLFVVYLPGKRILERWNTKTLEREAEVKAEFPGEVKALAMGSASNGPLVAALGEGRKAPLGGATLGYFDPATGKEVGYDIGGARNDFGIGLFNAPALIRVSADGSVVTAWGDNGHGGSQSEVIDGGRVTRYWQFGWLDSLIPGPDGRTLYGKGRRYSPDLKGDENPPPTGNDPAWLIPAAHGDYFLSLRPAAEKGARSGAARKATVDVLVGAEGKSVLHVGELPNFELPAGFEARGKTFDQYLALVPDAKVLAVVPTKNRDRLLLVRADLDSALAKAGFDYLFVTSRPPTAAVKGETYKYAVAAKSKKGGVKVTLESGPKGMTATPAGAVSWEVPKDFADPEVGVILKVTDAGGKEVFHSFRLTVRGTDEKPADAKGK